MLELVITSKILGASKFSSIIFSKLLAIDATINIWGIIPKKVATKKLIIFTLNIQGKTLEIANGIPPTNL